jgi:hypothetical protein
MVGMNRTHRARTLGLIAVFTLVAWSRLGSVETDLQCPDGCQAETRRPGIVAYELAGTAERADAILEAWGDEGRAVARRSLILDFAFLFTYGTFLFLAGCALADALPRTTAFPRLLAHGARGFAWAGAAAAGLDALENTALLIMLERGGSTLLSAMAYTAASLKFLLVLPAFAGILGVGVFVLGWSLLRKLRSPSVG